MTCIACGDKDADRLAQIEAKAERTRTVLANQCTQNSDCIVTGCRQTMCRAMPEPDYCDHRIVLSMESADDAQAVKRIVAEQLTMRESDTIRIGGYSANRWTLSFHATQAQRERVELKAELRDGVKYDVIAPDALDVVVGSEANVLYRFQMRPRVANIIFR